MNKKSKLFAGMVVLLAIGVMTVGCSETTSTTSSAPDGETQVQTNTKADEKKSFGIGEKSEHNGIIVTMTAVEEFKSSNEFLKPDDGKVFVLSEFEIENNSSSELNISSLMSFEAYADGYATQVDFTALSAASGKTQLDGTVAPGKKMKGIVAYQLPKEWKELEIQFTDNVWSSKNTVFKYSK